MKRRSVPSQSCAEYNPDHSSAIQRERELVGGLDPAGVTRKFSAPELQGSFRVRPKCRTTRGPGAFQQSQKNSRGLRKSSSKPSSGWKALTNAGKCGLGELVQEPVGAHDVQGDVPNSMPWFQPILLQSSVRSGAAELTGCTMRAATASVYFAMPAMMQKRSLRLCEETPQPQ